VKKDGRITASQIAMAADSGAYPYLTPYVLLYATGMAAGPYKIDHVHVDAIAAATNQTFTSAFRGFGGPQAALGYEQQMDEIAKVLGLDPLEVRRANYMQTGDTTCTGQEVSSAVWSEECATRALHALGERTPDTPTRKIGRGLASTFQSYGRITWFHDTSQAWVGVEQDGTVQLRCGVPDIGAGQSNSICQIAAEILGVPLDRVTIYATDSAVTPLAGTSTATRQLYMSGNAVTLAANAVRERLVKRAAEELGAAETELDLEGSRAVVASDPSRFIELADLVHLCAAEGIELSHLAQFNAPFTDGLDPETGQGDIWPDFTFGAVAVEVAVDTETGQIEVLKCAACHDVGRAINPAAVQGQIAGGTHQGLGYALMEEFVLENGLIKTPSLAEYLVPTALDFPETDVIILESGTGVGPFGAKGIGEPALTPAAPAVANAVADAIGTRIAELPLTPKRPRRRIPVAGERWTDGVRAEPSRLGPKHLCRNRDRPLRPAGRAGESGLGLGGDRRRASTDRDDEGDGRSGRRHSGLPQRRRVPRDRRGVGSRRLSPRLRGGRSQIPRCGGGLVGRRGPWRCRSGRERLHRSNEREAGPPRRGDQRHCLRPCRSPPRGVRARELLAADRVHLCAVIPPERGDTPKASVDRPPRSRRRDRIAGADVPVVPDLHGSLAERGRSIDQADRDR